jgi:DNA-binding MarR family transcriptional regulator
MATIRAALGQRGLIERTPDPNDGRRQIVSLTPTGKRRAESGRRAREEWLARAIQERYTEAERRVIVDALSLLERLTEQ